MFIRTITLILFSFMLLFASDNERKDNTKGTIIINFVGLKSDKGNVKVALANSKLNYKDHKNPFIGLSVDVNNYKAYAIIEDVPLGSYAVKAFHDEDSNDDLNTNFLGIPVEDYGFSNNARGVFGPPSWEAAKFELNGDTLRIEVTIK